MPKLLLTTYLTLLLTLCYSCHGEDSYPGMRNEEEREQIIALSDSIMRNPTNTLAVVRKLMNQCDDSLLWYDYYLLYGRHYLLTNTPDSTIGYAWRTLRFANGQEPQTPRTRGLAAMAHNTIAAYHYMLHKNPDTTLTHFNEAYRLMMQSDMKEKLPDICANIGDTYVAQGLLPEGSKWYRRALYLNDSLALPEHQTLTLYMGLGRIYTTVGDFEQARNYYEQTDKHFSEMKPNMQSYFLNNYGNYYYFRRDYDNALHTFKRLKQHLEQYHFEEHFDMYLCKINMADVYLNLGQTDSARIYVSDAEKYFRRENVDVGIYYAQTIRIGIALEEHKLDEVRQIVNKGKSLHVSDLDMQAIRNRYMNRYYAAIGDFRHAYSTLKVNIANNDSTEQKRKSMRSEDIMLRLTEDTIRLHHQLAMAEQNVQYVRTKWALGVAAALLLVIILAGLAIISMARKKELQNRLDMLNLRLLNSRQRISPHFVFNVLNSRINKTDREEADQLMMLARLIRTNLDITRSTYITLAQELDFVRQYVEVERTLMGQDFDFVMELPSHEVLNQITVPSMLVQILTENAMLHGLRQVKGEKRLTIRVECDERKCRISVIDNGPGFDVRQYNSERSRTGLSIIRNTIHAINVENKKEKMRFDICNDHGCHAILTIPRNLKLIKQ